jgi:transcriptional antiterminator
MAEPGAVETSSPAETISAEFADRLDMLEEAEQITPLARRLTELVLVELADELGLVLTEENASMFVTHLAVALTRLNRREMEAPPSALVDDEIRERTREHEVMRRVMGECEKLLDREVPESEIAYMTVHLCAILDDE